jgi:hypothetical protein
METMFVRVWPVVVGGMRIQVIRGLVIIALLVALSALIGR